MVSLFLHKNFKYWQNNFVTFLAEIDLRISGLPEIVISADTTDTFKRRLDKFWQHQDVLYYYKVELTGVRNRNQINAVT